eukprot:TRINITY_DN58262_c0_g1_i1.p1 TRINITY_DN58262_c0_g1~~TRINITY_DN58262_c0_g1_i1.p1  ORF type:complete len:809 (-),score=198.99 TRINITY_DN58262_c0_g1_i1:163-2589(-)
MGNGCGCKQSAAHCPLDPLKSPSTGVFALCGIGVYRRPSVHDVRSLFASCDRKGDFTLDAAERSDFAQRLLARFGNKDRPGINVEKAVEGLGSLADKTGQLAWPAVCRSLWSEGLPAEWREDPLTFAAFEEQFKRMDPSGTGYAMREDCVQTAQWLLKRLRLPKSKHPDMKKIFKGKLVSFLEWLHDFGPFYQANSKSWKECLPEKNESLGLCVDVLSFAQERPGTPVEFLACGADAFQAMLREVKKAKSEILLGFYEFTPEVPALRGTGREAWNDPDGTLIPQLKLKAEAGVKVRILLYDAPLILDVSSTDQRRTRYITELFNNMHANIECMVHPPYYPFVFSHHQKFIVVDRRSAVLGGVDWGVARYDTMEHPIFDPDNLTHPGCDYLGAAAPSEWYADPKLRVQDTVDRQKVPRFGWQDLCVTVWGAAAHDCAKNFIQRWNHARDDANVIDEAFGDGLVNGISEMSESPLSTDAGEAAPAEAHGKLRVQIVRSCAPWSAGVSSIERSHYQAWTAAIASAEHYMYIEQQYFIASNSDSDVMNEIGTAILKRVEAAIAQERPFRVLVVIPMKVAADAVSYFTRRTLLHGKSSMYSLIEKMLDGKEGKVDDYLSVCRLHSAAKSPAGEWKESQVFMHSKAMIVDDRVAVIGSANVNDRSMRGDGDSELGALLWDEELVEGELGGRKMQVGRNLRDFRVRLWKAYLGGQEILDPVCDAGYHGIWRATAAHNQKLLEDVFPAVPKASITSHGQWEDLIKAGGGAPKEPERLEGLRGLLTEFPRGFLGDKEQQGWLEHITTSVDAVKWVFL